MRFRDLIDEAIRALRGSFSRTLLTGVGITAGTVALTLILSLSVGLAHVIDDLVASDEQLRHVVVLPGWGRQASDGRSVPDVAGEMSDGKRQRLQRALLKRSRGGPSFQLRQRLLDAETERWAASLPGVASSRSFTQDRFQVELLPAAGDAPPPAAEREPAGASAAPPRQAALSIGVPAAHEIYPARVLAGRWFASDDERAVVVHEVLLWRMGLTSDDAQSSVIGRTLRMSAYAPSAGGLPGFLLPGVAARPTAPAYEVDLPVVGVLRERYGDERATFVEEAWAMQADLFLPRETARALWDRQPQRGGIPAMLLTARTLEDVASIEKSLTDRGFEVRTVREAVESMKRSLSIVTLVASALAGIAVFVAALGIVNTLVMSVMERTREIGLLKALGASDADVARLFLVEAGLLGVLGGAAGSLVGFALAYVGDELGRRKIEELFLMPFQGSLFRFPWWLFAGGIAFAVATSLLAAIVPTLRAARIDPVRALKHE